MIAQRQARAASLSRTAAGGFRGTSRPRLFERLRAPTGDAGSGLGLAIARAYARAHGGDLVYDPRDRGARFELILPQRGAAASAGGKGEMEEREGEEAQWERGRAGGAEIAGGGGFGTWTALGQSGRPRSTGERGQQGWGAWEARA